MKTNKINNLFKKGKGKSYLERVCTYCHKRIDKKYCFCLIATSKRELMLEKMKNVIE